MLSHFLSLIPDPHSFPTDPNLESIADVPTTGCSLQGRLVLTDWIGMTEASHLPARPFSNQTSPDLQDPEPGRSKMGPGHPIREIRMQETDQPASIQQIELHLMRLTSSLKRVYSDGELEQSPQSVEANGGPAESAGSPAPATKSRTKKQPALPPPLPPSPPSPPPPSPPPLPPQLSPHVCMVDGSLRRVTEPSQASPPVTDITATLVHVPAPPTASVPVTTVAVARSVVPDDRLATMRALVADAQKARADALKREEDMRKREEDMLKREEDMRKREEGMLELQQEILKLTGEDRQD